jgi:predicted nuclease of predicted toxin-antitoxin system
MKILLDAHISRPVMSNLMEEGHDCIHAGHLPPKTSDTELMRLAIAEQRVILTADKDFGELVFHRRLIAPGVVLLRFNYQSEAERTVRFQLFWPRIEKIVLGYFVVVTNHRVRRSPLPGAIQA